MDNLWTVINKVIVYNFHSFITAYYIALVVSFSRFVFYFEGKVTIPDVLANFTVLVDSYIIFQVHIYTSLIKQMVEPKLNHAKKDTCLITAETFLLNPSYE